jgi:hypothetical protein
VLRTTSKEGSRSSGSGEGDMRFTDRVVKVIRMSQKMLRQRAGGDSDVGVKSIYNALFGLAQMSRM